MSLNEAVRSKLGTPARYDPFRAARGNTRTHSDLQPVGRRGEAASERVRLPHDLRRQPPSQASAPGPSVIAASSTQRHRGTRTPLRSPLEDLRTLGGAGLVPAQDL